jgi:hypothetical protein
MIPLAHGDPQPAPLPCRARHHGFTAKIFNNMKYNAFFWALRDFIWVRVREKFNTKTHYKNRLLICKPILGQVKRQNEVLTRMVLLQLRRGEQPVAGH